MCPVYDFPERNVFSGDKIYNPYENLDSNNWYKANFHSHTYAWRGLTDGRKNDFYETIERYRKLKYDFIGISNYQKLIDYDSPDYIPVYEHGYNIKKNHQLVIGASSVDWQDFLFIQFLNNKQKVLSSLKTPLNIVALTHPNLRNAYSSEEVTQLTNYDYIEIVSQNYGKATDLWDSALSSGNLIYGLADDDSHNWEENEDMGRCFNLVNCSSKSTDGLINSLKAGKTIAVDLNTNDNNSVEHLIKEFDNLPKLVKMEVINDSLFISFNKVIILFEFIGQNGRVKKNESNTGLSVYLINTEDTYIRIKVETTEHSIMYFNPIVKYRDDYPIKNYASINKTKTWGLRTGLIIIFSVFTILFFYKRKKYKITQ